MRQELLGVGNAESDRERKNTKRENKFIKNRDKKRF